ncbi:hypothetical protein [Leifsonia sp. NPDC058230]|uniref:hypothetical protein n=1 Tax=Leifsonia sp. NPDC058230 TaxID=3346391 RepID=UPI0036D94256
MSLGPAYTGDSISERLGIEHDMLRELVVGDKILEVRTSDGIVYPAFQISADGELLPGLCDVIAELASGVDDSWTWWRWLVTCTESREGPAAWELMRARRYDVVVREAGGMR